MLKCSQGRLISEGGNTENKKNRYLLSLVKPDIESMEEKSEQASNESNSVNGNSLKATFLKTVEGRILLVGVVLALIYTFWLGIMFLLSPDDAQFLVLTVILICMVIETVLVLIFYPLFVLSWQHLLVLPWLKKTFEHIRNAAEMHKGTIQRYGIIGLFAFVWFPFWMTGPVVGCVIGFLLGLRLWLNLTVVLAGTYVAILGWALFLGQLHKSVASYSSYATMVLLGLLVIIIFVGHLLHKTLGRNNKKA
jgi:uncharacterized membrane protein